MGFSVVLAEKPSVAKDIARVLNCSKKGPGYFEGSKYLVTWALGHLVTLADPEAYDEKYKTWKIEDLPMLPKQLKLVVIRQSGKQFNTIKGLLHRKDVQEIIIATDAGREGELVARWIIEKAGVKKPLKRLWISSVTDKAIKEGFNKLKNGKDYDNLYASAVARAEADWLVGLNATRALTCKFNAQLSCGRVQTPTLAIISKREEEIKNFKPRPFYGITATAQGFQLTWQDNHTKETRTFDKVKRDKIFSTISDNKVLEIIEIKKSTKKMYPPKLYDLTELQRDGNRLFGFSAKETLSIMQRLYENHKLLTYPRTDSRYISTDIVDTLKDRIKACGVGPYRIIATKLLQLPLKSNQNFVDDSKVSDHHAIIPTEQPALLGALSDKERKVYDLVIKRFLAVLCPPLQYEQTAIKARIGQELFIAQGKTTISQGWKEVYQGNFDSEDNEEDLTEQRLPALKEGAQVAIDAIKESQGDTKPPAPFNEGTLLSAMENPAKFMDEGDKDLVKTLGQTGGLGTVATRADIIEKLFNSFLLEKRGKDIFITGKGRQLLELVPEELKSPALTAQWEQKLGAIAKGTLNKDVFINEMKNYAQELVREIKDSKDVFKHDNKTRTKCPECGKYLLEVAGKKGKLLVCEDRECGFRKGLSKITNARCPQCKKKLELRGEGEGQIFVCKCGFREKLATFNERKKGNTKVGKGDVAKYLREQKKAESEPINTALADALAKLKFK